ncbi:MAG: hypothetical protein PVF58_11970 [Candidatus Methanofastidiosia archaeon]|jgi:hypothetical protein
MVTEVEVDDNLRIHDLVQTISQQYKMHFDYHDNIYLLIGNTIIPLDACKTLYESGITEGDVIFIDSKYLSSILGGGGGIEPLIMNLVISLISGLSAQFIYNKVRKNTKIGFSHEHISQLLKLFEKKVVMRNVTDKRTKLVPKFIRRNKFCDEAAKIIINETKDWESICGKIGPELLVRFEEKKTYTAEELTTSTEFARFEIEKCLMALKQHGKILEFISVCPHIFESIINLSSRIAHVLYKYI